MIACESDSDIELWQVSPCAVPQGAVLSDACVITDKCVGGDADNLGWFFTERYYQMGQTLDSLLPLVAHTLLMASEINPTGVEGLEIVKWVKGQGIERLREKELTALSKRSRKLDAQLRDSLLEGWEGNSTRT